MDPVEQEGAAPPASPEAAPPAEAEPAAPPAEPSEAPSAAEEPVVDREVTEVAESPGEAPWSGLDAEYFVGIGVAVALLLLLVLAFTRLRPLGRTAFQEAVPTVEEERPEAVPVAPPPPTQESLVGRLRTSLGRSRAALQERFDRLFGREIVDEQVFHDLQDTLLSADVGVVTASRLVDHLRARSQAGEGDPAVLRDALRTDIRALLAEAEAPLGPPPPEKPWVILVVGVNGSGKTTTIGKLAARLKAEGRSVLLAAGDTYRAAAIEQLQIWAERAGVDIVAHQQGADPGAVVYDALERALARAYDVVIVDTAGRLQTARPLMQQLEKVRRVIDKKVPGAPHETLLVLDGTMGQNALSQAQLFHEATPLTGVAVTKLDGTAKGGMILTIASELRIPVKLIGIGEKLDDLQPFDADAFVQALA